MSPSSTQSAELRARLRAVVDHLAHVLPGQAPIREFVHHNTLHGYEHSSFAEALTAARRRTGATGFLPSAKYRDLYRQGRIEEIDLRRIIDGEAALQAAEALFESDTGPVTRRDIYLRALLHPFTGVTGCQLNWQIEEFNALASFQGDVPAPARQRLLDASGTAEPTAIADLWRACLGVLELEYFLLHPEELLDLSPERAEAMLASLPATEDLSVPQTLSQFRIQHSARRKLKGLLDRVGDDLTLSGLLLQLTGQDLQDEVRPYLIRLLGDFLDLGVAAWHSGDRSRGFYAMWRGQCTAVPTLLLQGLYPWHQHLDELPDDPLEAIVFELRRLDLPEARWPNYLERLALELPGWSGMFLWRSQHPHYRQQEARVEMLDYLAVRLVLERLFALRLCAEQWGIEPSLDVLRGHFHRNPAEFLVRQALFNEHLPEYLSSRAQRLLQRRGAWQSDALRPHWLYIAHLIWTWQQSPAADHGGHSVFRSAWPLFRLMQHLGLSGPELRRLDRAQVDAVFDCLARLDEGTAGFIWLRAYENHYRDRVFNALLNNHGRGRWANRSQRPAAQVVCCMDEREEGLRRHLEEIEPGVETLGAAAHFGVANFWRGLDDTEVRALCPVVVVPSHEIHEVPRAGSEDAFAHHRKRHGLRVRLRDVLHQEIRRNLLSSTAAIATAAPGAALALVGKTLAPHLFGRWAQRWQRAFDKSVPTDIAITAERGDDRPAAAAPQLGFTTEEQVQRVGNLLRTIGLARGFAPLVVIMGHGSGSDNNPHMAAYDCGACSGNHSGPNARIFAAMANRPQVRGLLRELSIEIPDDCWFIGAEHNTCSEEITWYDLDQVPVHLRDNLSSLQESLRRATMRHAHERCRKFASAPNDPSPEQALRHVAARSLDFSQTRPELGHATNACALIGRRSLSQGLFLDRRAFLISYDPHQDPDGRILESLLLANGPVGAGINLEYYFSTVDDEGYGAGSKVTHNIAGAFGLMDGTMSDLRTGLPRQMTEIHEPMRLLVIVEAKTELLSDIYQRQPPLQELIGNGWLLLAAKDPDSDTIHVFDPATAWARWQGPVWPLAAVACSADHYHGAMGPLEPVLVRQPEGEGAG